MYTKRNSFLYPAALALAGACALSRPALAVNAWGWTTTCDTTTVNKLSKTIAYMRGAVRVPAFRECLVAAIGGHKNLGTAQENGWVGPYVRCTGPPGTDTARLGTNPESLADGVIGALNDEGFMRINCNPVDGPTTPTSWVISSGPHDYGHAYSFDIFLSAKTRTAYPTHQTWPTSMADMAFPQPSYQIDELAGILLHEILHTHDFDHGGGSSLTKCSAFDAYECDGLDGSYGQRCRMNSMNEIAEACMSEVVEQATSLCSSMACPSFQLPFPNSAGTCSCVWTSPSGVGFNNLALGKIAVQTSTYPPAPIRPIGGTQPTDPILVPQNSATASRAVDGNTDGNYFNNSVSHTLTQDYPQWVVDLGRIRPIESISVHNRTDCCANRLQEWSIWVSDTGATWTKIFNDSRAAGAPTTTWISRDGSAYNGSSIGTGGTNAGYLNATQRLYTGRYVMVQINCPASILQLAEVKVFAP